MPTERTEIRDGREFRVVVLPKDPRLQPKATRERTFFVSLTPGQKRAFIRDRIRASKRKRKRRRRSS